MHQTLNINIKLFLFPKKKKKNKKKKIKRLLLAPDKSFRDVLTFYQWTLWLLKQKSRVLIVTCTALAWEQ